MTIERIKNLMRPTVYETIRVRQGEIPFLDRHVARLGHNSRAVGIAPPHEVEASVRAGRRTGLPDHALRVEWDGVILAVLPKDLPSLAPMRVVTVETVHEGYRIKTTERDFLEAARGEAIARGADEGLLLTPAGYIAEGTLFAVAWFDENTLRLPSLELGILPSIGRARLIEVADRLGIPVFEGSYARSAIDGRAVFGATATRGVVEVHELDGTAVPRDHRIDLLREGFWPAIEFGDAANRIGVG